MLYQPDISEDADLYEESEDWVDHLMKNIIIPVRGLGEVAGAIRTLCVMESLIRGNYIQIPSLGIAFNDKDEYLMIDTGNRHLKLKEFKESASEP